MDGDLDTYCIRIAVFGKQRARVAKVLSLLSDLNRSQVLQQHASTERPVQVNIEFLACVATFGSYQGEDGKEIRYLAKAEYHGADGQIIRGSSLAPFFDASENTCLGDAAHDEANRQGDAGISAVLIGCGIDAVEDRTMVEKFIQTLTSSGSSMVVVECLQPGNCYGSMEEENDAFRCLDADEKAEASRRGIMGPGKMALFVRNIVTAMIQKKTGKDNVCNENSGNESPESVATIHEDVEHFVSSPLFEPVGENAKVLFPSVDNDPEKIRFACRKCRFILFGEDDTTTHIKSNHSFSRRKSSSNTDAKKCSSVFLSSGLDWMGDMSAFEGRLDCPKCASKVGQWNWGGTQCSCGSWITPAIYFPMSKVDLKRPIQIDRSSTEDAAVMHQSVLNKKFSKEY
mmetsp:Transcript_16129/g.25149  ORF Transcript_16129/g.25149 Transcript_16129/m.25149 type:complete len:400 (-) Transcript_16129:732-1931(-)|eukprot:CAMPEP_0196818930 /NCGR_PEP_ID=MMETSP1362-20130617/68219_1 /TAXON_ID=163516 /ORGANISM="Leptocylindrus danicus, Strain CCMP1856" /LENGTH=399 /DNA_ID=CAMNT_0042197231 /DNA_START=108 /DNA_END=1307 /DNA_ORIENTATION=+